MKIFFTFSIFVFLTGCFSNPGSHTPQKPRATSTPSALPDLNSDEALKTAKTMFFPSSVKIEEPLNQRPSSQQTTPPRIHIAIDTLKTTPKSAALSQFCALKQKDCVCEFSWTQNNTLYEKVNLVPRQESKPIELIQNGLLVCSAPSEYYSTLENNTSIKVQIRGAKNHPSPDSFVFSSIHFSKNSNNKKDTDSKGNIFESIYRYSCYNKHKRAQHIFNAKMTGAKEELYNVSVENQSYTRGVPKTSFHFPLANKFCFANTPSDPRSVTKLEDIGIDEESCYTLKDPNLMYHYSAQSYYFDLYVRASSIAASNTIENENYVCAKTEKPNEKISSTNLYPMDSTFKLATLRSKEFPIGVEAYNRLGLRGDVETNCSSENNSLNPVDNATKKLIKACMGFAAKPTEQGKCQPIQMSNGLLTPTYRLRRYIALYPKLFHANGQPYQDAQLSNTIYVIDRPVQIEVNGRIVMGSMLGPKPCNFAYANRGDSIGYAGGAGTLNNTSDKKYSGTNSSDWVEVIDGKEYYKNIDYLQLPRHDGILQTNTIGDSQNNEILSCSAAIAQYDFKNPLAGIATVHKTNKSLKAQYIRGAKPWAPHYIEDTDFKACAPLSDPFADPPLHIQQHKETGNVSYCTENYLNHNPYWQENTSTTHSSGIQRSAHFEQTPLFKNFPLLAPEQDVEKMLETDSSYSCLITSSPNSSDVFTRSPKNGCCAGSKVISFNAQVSGGTPPTNVKEHWEGTCTPPTHSTY